MPKGRTFSRSARAEPTTTFAGTRSRKGPKYVPIRPSAIRNLFSTIHRIPSRLTSPSPPHRDFGNDFKGTFPALLVQALLHGQMDSLRRSLHAYLRPPIPHPAKSRRDL